MLAPPELYVIVAVFPSTLTNCSEIASNAVILDVVTPTILAPPAVTLRPAPAVTIPTESILVTSS